MSTYRLRIREKGRVDLVHSGEIGHVGQENVDLDRVVEARPAGLEDGIEVAKDLSLSSRLVRILPVQVDRLDQFPPFGSGCSPPPVCPWSGRLLPGPNSRPHLRQPGLAIGMAVEVAHALCGRGFVLPWTWWKCWTEVKVFDSEGPRGMRGF